MLVQPQQFFRIELGGRGSDVIKIEPFDELLAREHLVVAVRPAQAAR
jgi:hypothetical protein